MFEARWYGGRTARRTCCTWAGKTKPTRCAGGWRGSTPCRIAPPWATVSPCWTLSEHGPTWGPDTGVHEGTRGVLLEAGKYLEAAAAQHEPRLLVLDPAAAAYGGNENARAHVREWIGSLLGKLAAQHRCGVLVLSHPSKGHEVSGSTDWIAAARSVIQLELADTASSKAPTIHGAPKDEQEPGWRLRRGKANYARVDATAWLGRAVRTDADGKLERLEWTTCSRKDARRAFADSAKGVDWEP